MEFLAPAKQASRMIRRLLNVSNNKWKRVRLYCRGKKSEQSKRKEDKLAKILKFIQTNQKSGILMLVPNWWKKIFRRVLFCIILFGKEEIQAELKREVSGLAQIEAPRVETGEEGVKSQSDTRGAKIPSEFSLAAKFENPALSLKVKAEID